MTQEKIANVIDGIFEKHGERFVCIGKMGEFKKPSGVKSFRGVCYHPEICTRLVICNHLNGDSRSGHYFVPEFSKMSIANKKKENLIVRRISL